MQPSLRLARLCPQKKGDPLNHCPTYVQTYMHQPYLESPLAEPTIGAVLTVTTRPFPLRTPAALHRSWPSLQGLSAFSIYKADSPERNVHYLRFFRIGTLQKMCVH